MELEAFYREMNVEYRTVLKRMLGKEEMVSKFLKKFLTDSTYAGLEKAVIDKNYEEVLIKAHTMKGICSNLDLHPLYEESSEMVRCVRAKETEKVAALFEKMQVDYDAIAEQIRSFV